MVERPSPPLLSFLSSFSFPFPFSLLPSFDNGSFKSTLEGFVDITQANAYRGQWAKIEYDNISWQMRI